MNTRNRIQIAGPFDRLFTLASDIARWPELLPHYRWVKILDRQGNVLTAEMAARHKGIPLWWKTTQRLLPAQKRIEFTHIGGITRGMEVAWTFEEAGESCRGPVWLVEIHHAFNPRWGPLKPWLADRLIGNHFVRQVANKTLSCIKARMERA